MASTTQDVAVVDRKYAIVASLIVFVTLGTAFVIWRLLVSFRMRNRLGLSDYLMMIAAALNIVANIFSIKSAYEGQGKHLKDVASDRKMLVQCFFDIYIAQVTNVYAMAFLKSSISAYLINLKFSAAYRVIIWFSVGLVVTCNFILPSIVLFGNCHPLSLRWNKAQPGSCWPKTANAASGYTQSVANIITDIIYSSAPLVYLASVQLARTTQWGLRVVFLFGLLGTACSIAKLFKLNALQNTTDVTYESVDLTIWSAAEVSTGLVVACLPPLRKTFDNLFRKLVPSLASRNGTRVTRSNNFNLKSYDSSKPHSVVAAFKDNDSQWAILPDTASERIQRARREHDPEGGIVKTTNVQVSDTSSREELRPEWNDGKMR